MNHPLRAPYGLHTGSIRAPYRLYTGSLRAPYGLHTGSIRAPYGLPTGVRALILWGASVLKKSRCSLIIIYAEGQGSYADVYVNPASA